MKSENIFDGKVLKLRVDTVEMPDRKYSKREIIEHSGGVTIVAVTDEGQLIFVKQYRKALEEFLLELPAGKLEYKEDPLECAKRELKEETGYTSEDIELLCISHSSPGYSTEKIYIFLAKDLKEGTQDLDEGEYLEVEKIDIEKALEMVKNNEITDSKTMIGILMAQNKLK